MGGITLSSWFGPVEISITGILPAVAAVRPVIRIATIAIPTARSMSLPWSRFHARMHTNKGRINQIHHTPITSMSVFAICVLIVKEMYANITSLDSLITSQVQYQSRDFARH